MLSKEFVEILACPKCKGVLEYRHKPEHPDEAFICHSCKLVYPVVDDIPNFIIEEAKPLESEGAK